MSCRPSCWAWRRPSARSASPGLDRPAARHPARLSGRGLERAARRRRAGGARRAARLRPGTCPAGRRRGGADPAARPDLRPAARPPAPAMPAASASGPGWWWTGSRRWTAVFGRWLPAATLAVLGPVLVIAAAGRADPGSGLLLAIAGLLYPSPSPPPASAPPRPAGASSNPWNASRAASSTGCAACPPCAVQPGRTPRPRRSARRRRRVQVRAIDDAGRALPWSGTSAPELLSALALASSPAQRRRQA